MPEKTIQRTDLNVRPENGEYRLCFGNQTLYTPGENPVLHRNPDLLQHMIDELAGLGVDRLVLGGDAIRSPRMLGAYLLYATQVDFIEPGIGPRPAEVRQFAACDPLFQQPSLFDYYRDGWAGAVTTYLAELGVQLELTGMGGSAALSRLCEAWQDLSAAQKAVVLNLFSLHGNHFILPLLLVQGRLSAEDYATALVQFGFVTQGLMLGGNAPRLEAYLDDAQSCMKYLEYW